MQKKLTSRSLFNSSIKKGMLVWFLLIDVVQISNVSVTVLFSGFLMALISNVIRSGLIFEVIKASLRRITFFSV